MSAARDRPKPVCPAVLVALALMIGLLIALADSSPGWDSTGVTAGALVIAAGITAFLGRDRPWVWAMLVGLPTPVTEIATLGTTGSVLALLFGAVGAAIGWTLARTG
jgi:hypothetical protein